VPSKTPGNSEKHTDKSANHGKPFRVLLVDAEPQVRELISNAIDGEQMTLISASSVAEADQCLAEAPVDLALIEPDLPDGCGIELADRIKCDRPIAQTIMITSEPSLERAVDALRIGAGDFISKPLDLADLNKRVHAAIDRHRSDRDQKRRLKRLRRICKKLNQAHDDVSRQVDILCNDLVTAYQELASQFNEVSETRQFTRVLGDELDLEHVLRKSLEHLLQKAGPTNAAIFLPTTADEYTLGGYVNYDCSTESADLLLEHLAGVAAPRFAGADVPVHVTDNQRLDELLGDDWNYLADSHFMAVSCRAKDECMAVLVLFRDQSEPFDGNLASYLEAIAPLLADRLAKVIRVHHRHKGAFGNFPGGEDDSIFT
jgi:DNA-binding response OmpR family regulator